MVVLAFAALLVVLGVALSVLDEARSANPDRARPVTNRRAEWPAAGRGPSASDPPEAA